MAIPNSYQQYKEQSIYTMTGEELLIKLLDELVKDVKKGEFAIKNHKLEAANDNLVHAQDIVRHLMLTLNDDYEISKEIKPLYEFFHQQLIDANIKKDVAALEALIPLLEEMRDTWQEAMRLSHAK